MNTKYRVRHAHVEASEWTKNGDHPDDDTHEIGEPIEKDEQRYLSEGKVVRRFRHPGVPGGMICAHCGETMPNHGWIDSSEAGRVVCPGDHVITDAEGNHFPVKPDVFKLVYEERVTMTCSDCGNELGDAYYQDVPGIGDLCLGCHTTRRPPAGTSTFDAKE